MIPRSCFSGTFSNGQTMYFPVLSLEVYAEGTNLLSSKFYYDYYHNPIAITSSSYSGGAELKIKVKYYWANSPARDYTVKVYSKHNA